MRFIYILFVVLLLIGCVPSEEEAPGQKVVKEVEEKEEEFSEDGYASLLRMAMTKTGLKNVKITTENEEGVRTIHVRYLSSAPSEKMREKEIGFVALTFMGVRKEGWNVHALRAYVEQKEDKQATTWYITKEWVDNADTGKISGNELAFNALSTYQVS